VGVEVTDSDGFFEQLDETEAIADD